MRIRILTTVGSLLLVVQKATCFAVLPPQFATKASSCHVKMTAKDDFFHQPHFEVEVASATPPDSDRMGRIVECAESQGECSVEEMFTMIEELESLNTSCEGEESGECAVDAVEDRKVLQQALSLQSDLIKEEELLDAPNSKHSEEREDHSFNHYVDYRDIGTYESH